MQRKIGSFKAETTSLDTGLGLMLSSSRHTSAEKGDPGKELCFQVRPRSARMTLKHAICSRTLEGSIAGLMGGDGGFRRLARVRTDRQPPDSPGTYPPGRYMYLPT